jgi:hypothetical protein
MGIQSARLQLEQMDRPGVAVTMVNGCQQIAIGRGGVDAGEHGLRALKKLIVQSHTDRRQLNSVVDGDGALRRPLVDIVHGAQTNGRAQHIAHEFHDPAHRGMSDHCQPERGLFQPSFGDRQRKQHLVLVVSLLSGKEIIQRGVGLVHLPVDERAAHAMPGGQGADRFCARQSSNGHHLAFVGSQFCGGSANGLIHGGVASKMGPHYPALSLPLACVTQL